MLPANVRRLLLNPRYIGANVVGKRRVMKQEGVVTSNRADQSTWTVKPDQHEPIVDREVFDRVQQRLGKVTALNTRTREQSPMNPFPQGLVRCRKCGAGTVFKKNSKDGYVTYVLVCRRRQESNATDAAECSGSIAVDMLRNKVVAHLAMLLQGRKLRDAIIARKPQADPEIARLEAVLKAAIRKRDNLLVAIENADAGIASLAKKLSEREAEIVDTERRLRALRAVQPTAVNPATIETDAWSVKNALLKADYATVRPLIGKLFSEISVDFGAAAELRKAQRTLHAKFPTRTEAEVKAAKLRAAEIVDQIQWSLNGPVSFAYTWGGPVFSDTRNLLDFATELAEIAKVRPKDRVISGRKKARSS